MTKANCVLDIINQLFNFEYLNIWRLVLWKPKNLDKRILILLCDLPFPWAKLAYVQKAFIIRLLSINSNEKIWRLFFDWVNSCSCFVWCMLIVWCIDHLSEGFRWKSKDYLQLGALWNWFVFAILKSSIKQVRLSSWQWIVL